MSCNDKKNVIKYLRKRCKMSKKIIGISPRFWSNETQEYVRVGVQYTNQLQRDDLIPFIIVDSVNLEDTLNLCDGFLIIGGDDLNPETYGESNELGLSKDIHPIADKVDKAIIDHAIKNKKPILGICRGIQSICAFMGGKLVQDLKYEQISHPLTEDHKHYVDKVSNIGVAKLLPDHFLINSWHHQAVKIAPEGFEVIFKNDETIEAIEHTTLPILGVQWHPERQSARRRGK